MSRPQYEPVGPRGQVGPRFEFHTMAVLWITGKERPIEWTVRQVEAQNIIAAMPSPGSQAEAALIAAYAHPSANSP